MTAASWKPWVVTKICLARANLSAGVAVGRERQTEISSFHSTEVGGWVTHDSALDLS
jgi:hypothetical protein